MKKYSFYEQPNALIINLVQHEVLCASDGTAQDYGSGSIWDAGNDNE